MRYLSGKVHLWEKRDIVLFLESVTIRTGFLLNLCSFKLEPQHINNFNKFI
jgi:hypothetical protein